MIYFISQKYTENQKPAVDKIKEPILDSIASAVGGRYHLSFTKQDIASLWFLCKQVLGSPLSVVVFLISNCIVNIVKFFH